MHIRRRSFLCYSLFFPDFLLRAYCSLVLSPCLISTALSESQVPGLEKVASVPATAPARCLDAVRCTAHRCFVFLSHVLLLKTAVLLLMKVQLLSPLSDALLKNHLQTGDSPSRCVPAKTRTALSSVRYARVVRSDVILTF